jgi:flavin-dependent thymidylate synthase
MRVTLIDCTGSGQSDPGRYAANLLLFTKSTRLGLNPNTFLDIVNLSNEEILIKLKEMANTNPGSWEFVHFTFLIEGVTRSFTHQLVRTRQASYAQQSLRVVEMKDFTYGTGPSIENNHLVKGAYDNTMNNSFQCYKHLIESGVNIEDARGVLPINIHTNICMSINMRNFITLTRKRTSLRVQKEYRDVMDAMVIQIEDVYPWFYIFYKSDEMKAYKDLQYIIEQSKGLTQEEKTEIYKKLDIIKTGQD